MKYANDTQRAIAELKQENADLRAKLAAANIRVSELEGLTAFYSPLSEIEARGRRIAELERDRDEWKESCIDANKRFADAERKLAEQQALTRTLPKQIADDVFETGTTAHMMVARYWKDCADESKLYPDAAATSELNKLLSEAREEGRKEALAALVGYNKPSPAAIAGVLARLAAAPSAPASLNAKEKLLLAQDICDGALGKGNTA